MNTSNIKTKLSIFTKVLCLLCLEFIAAAAMIDRSDNLGLYRFFRGQSVRIVPDAFFIIHSLIIVLLALLFFYSDKIASILKLNTSDEVIRVIRLSLPVLFVAFIILLVKLNIINSYNRENKIMQLRERFLAEKTVIHACGSISVNGIGYSYTNSMEALENCYNAGNRICEIDFMITSDHGLICAHDESDVWANGYEFTSVPTEAEFLDAKYSGVLTSMGIEDVADFMREHKDLIVVTDIKDNNPEGCSIIAAKYPDLLDRFVVQIYHANEFDSVYNMGFHNIIFTIYTAHHDEKTPEALIAASRKYNLLGITFGRSRLSKEDFFEPLSKNINCPLFVHTINDPEEIKTDLEKGLLIYTDNTDNDHLRF